MASNNNGQAELFGLLWWSAEHRFRLRANDVIRFDGRLARIVRVNESCAVIVMSRPVREFKTRFDKPVRFQPSPVMYRISPNSEVEILNRKPVKRTKHSPR